MVHWGEEEGWWWYIEERRRDEDGILRRGGEMRMVYWEEEEGWGWYTEERRRDEDGILRRGGEMRRYTENRKRRNMDCIWEKEEGWGWYIKNRMNEFEYWDTVSSCSNPVANTYSITIYLRPIYPGLVVTKSTRTSSELPNSKCNKDNISTTANTRAWK